MKKVAAVAFLVLFCSVSVVHADEWRYLERVLYERGFTDLPDAACGGWYTTGSAEVGYRKCGDAWFYEKGDSIVKYVDYTMPLDGMLRFRINRNDHNAGWSWKMLATIKQPGNGTALREVATGVNDDEGMVPLYMGERIERLEFKAVRCGVHPAHFRVLKVWTVASNDVYSQFLPIVQ